MKFSYKRLLVPFVIIAFAVVALKWIERTKVEEPGFTSEQLTENKQNWFTDNQQEVFSRQEKIEPAR